MFDIIVTLVLGFFTGLIARALHPGKDNIGMIMTAVLGVSGSVIAQWLGILLGFYQKGSSAGFLASIIGAIILLFIYGQIQKTRGVTAISDQTSNNQNPPV